MKRIYFNYEQWEDYINWMYNIPKKILDSDIEKCIELLTDVELFWQICNEVLIDWKISSMVNLLNTSCNRQAWLWQSACCYKYWIPEIVTKLAWSKLNDQQKLEANNKADEYIKIFELWYKK